jgi:glutamate-1-semialdehyde 2,1-aminomutase
VKTLAIVQARMDSTRFSGKVMANICGMPMIELLLERLMRASLIDKVLIATSKNSSNDLLVEYVEKLGYTVFRGDEDDVLDRYYQAAKEEKADLVLRITGDCPLVDPVIVDKVITRLKDEDVDYASNIFPPTFPDGLDAEVFTFHALEIAWNEAKTIKDREHVTTFIRESGQFSCANITCETDYSRERWTVDEIDDFKVVRKIFEHFNPRNDFSWLEVLDLCKKQPERFMANRHISRDEGSKLAKGQKLWKRAKRVIPGGNMLLSKRPEMFLPEQWPTYFSKAKGCTVWDLDGREYIDMSILGVGTNTLGYGHPEVDDAVRMVVDMGNMSTLNCPEEIYLAEKLIELHPWADMARFARSGGETNAIAIRIARAAVGKDKVAVCGYHGWHDWYLSANLGDEKNLDAHLLPGLEPKGVPENLCDTVYPFCYNKFSELEELVKTHDIGVIKMEVSRNIGPKDNFLHKVRKLASERGIVLIFDECTSGFRQSFGGLHKTFGVEPDMAVFGKALGNGYSITAVIGRREIMEAAQSTFISSTFWTERIGPAAALKTLEVMKKQKSWEQITQTGKGIMAGWKVLAEKYSLSITINGLPALASFSFNSTNALAYKTLITQEMFAKGYLAGNSVYACTAHTPEILSNFFEQLDPIFGLIKECEEGRDIMSLLQGPVCHVGFKRLN